MVRQRITPFEAVYALAEAAMPGCELRHLATIPLDCWVEAADAARIDDLARACTSAHEAGVPIDALATWMAVLASREGATFEALFELVLRDLREVQAFVRVMRSGVTGRRSLGTRPRRAVRRFLDQCPESLLIAYMDAADDMGKPTVADLIRMTHPRPTSLTRQALYGWLVDRRAHQIPRH